MNINKLQSGGPGVPRPERATVASGSLTPSDRTVRAGLIACLALVLTGCASVSHDEPTCWDEQGEPIPCIEYEDCHESR